jgi:hypothetical protein
MVVAIAFDVALSLVSPDQRCFLLQTECNGGRQQVCVCQTQCESCMLKGVLG